MVKGPLAPGLHRVRPLPEGGLHGTEQQPDEIGKQKKRKIFVSTLVDDDHTEGVLSASHYYLYEGVTIGESAGNRARCGSKSREKLKTGQGPAGRQKR